MALTNTAAAAVLAIGALLAAAPANAGSTVSVSFEFGHPTYASYYHHHTLSPQQVRRILRDQGFRQIDYVDRRGSIYQVEATNPRGRRVGLVVSARSGQILNRYRL